MQVLCNSQFPDDQEIGNGFLDTNIIGRGEIWIETTAYLPDTDYEGGIRPEVDKSATGIRIV